MVPAAAAWIAVPLGMPMSIPGWKLPQRGPKGLVIGPETGQMNPAALAEAGAPVLPLCAAAIFASRAALAALSASDSATAAFSCAFVCARGPALLAAAPAGLCWLVPG